MQSRIDDLLDVSRIARGKVKLNKTRVDIVGLLHEVLQNCGRELAAKSLHVSLDSSEAAVNTSGDRERLSQVLANLVHNATTFYERGSSVTVCVRKMDSLKCRVEIEDSGI